jgi:hypothetical protein
MKKLILFSLALLSCVAITITGCKKEDSTANVSTPATSFEKTVKVYDSSKMNSVTIKLSSENEDELNRVSENSFSLDCLTSMPTDNPGDVAVLNSTSESEKLDDKPNLTVGVIEFKKQPNVVGFTLTQSVNFNSAAAAAVTCSTNYNTKYYTTVAAKPRATALNGCSLLVRFGTYYRGSYSWGTSWSGPVKNYLQSTTCWGDNFNYYPAMDVKMTGSGYCKATWSIPCGSLN